MDRISSVPYPAIERHGLISDRRSAALVCADGTVDWLCVPRFDGEPAFGALLDARRGGFWKLGPMVRLYGRQSYEQDSGVLRTRWDELGFSAELSDAMLMPETARPEGREPLRVRLRRLRCERGRLTALFDLQPAAKAPQPALWLSRRLVLAEGRRPVPFVLEEGEELWAAACFGGRAPWRWSAEEARARLAECDAYWRGWSRKLRCAGPRADRLRRDALAIHMLGYAPTGAMVAAPTTSLPERLGGNWNADYRFCWIRDTSIAMSVLAQLGDLDSARRFFDWVVEAVPDGPLQPVYGIDARKRLPQKKLSLHGYRGSAPVRVGNHAYKQTQRGSLGYLADGLLAYLERGGAWREEYWRLTAAFADREAALWSRPDNGLWELGREDHYVSSKLMSWTALDRAGRIARRLGRAPQAERWARAAEEVKAEALERGWSPRLRSLRQRYGAHSLDAAVALASLKGMLAPGDPRMLSTLDALERDLTIDRCVYRFVPSEVPGLSDLPLGAFEGAFVPASMLVAAALAKAGLRERAEALLERAEGASGEVGLFAEAVEARSRTGFLGNFPLAFSHAEHARAVLELGEGEPRAVSPARRPRRARARPSRSGR